MKSLAGLEVPGLAWEPLVVKVPGGGRVAGAGGGSTDNKAFPSLALSFELGLGMAIFVWQKTDGNMKDCHGQVLPPQIEIKLIAHLSAEEIAFPCEVFSNFTKGQNDLPK